MLNDKTPDGPNASDSHAMMRDASETAGATSNEAQPDPGIPLANVRVQNKSLVSIFREHPSKFWFLTLVCLIIAAALFWSGYRRGTTLITVRFEQGYGIKPGDRLQHRGIDVGEITAVTLNATLSHVDVAIELEPAAAAIARQGSRFWIERPRISLARVSGLETVVGAKHVGVLPGPLNGPRTTSFTGDESPPTLLDTETLDIRIRFANGYGLSIGDVVKYRGIVVGEVVSIELNEQLQGIEVLLRLTASGRHLARAGTRFWVERPRVQLTGVSGLDTLTSGQHVAAAVGPKDAPAQYVFDGLEEPPPLLELQPDGLEVVLASGDRQGIERGAPLTFRGFRIGQVVSVGLSADAAQIESRVMIEPAYRQLIRQNSVFWSVGGFDASFGFGGLKINSETLATIAAGGVAVGTPDPPGPLAIVGSQFELSTEPGGWRDWTPRIPIGTAMLPVDVMLPQPSRVALVWKERFLGISRTTQANGWGLLLSDHQLIGPANLLSPPAAAVGGVASLQFDGNNMTVTLDESNVVGGLALRKLPTDREGGWPRNHIRPMTSPEDCLVVFGGIDSTRSLPATRLKIQDGQITIDPSFTLPKDAHGASVIATRDGNLVGIVAIETGRATLLGVPSLVDLE